MIKRNLLIVGAVVLGCFNIYAKKRPNIILIFTDQQNVNAMSASGNPFLHTPNMDALAEE